VLRTSRGFVVAALSLGLGGEQAKRDTAHTDMVLARGESYNLILGMGPDLAAGFCGAHTSAGTTACSDDFKICSLLGSSLLCSQTRILILRPIAPYCRLLFA
jgi:hypothetical protein